MRALLRSAALAATLAACAGPADAVPIALADGNSRVLVVPEAASDTAGVVSWVVDSVEQLFRHAFYLRVGGGPAMPLDALGLATPPPSAAPGTDALALRYGSETGLGARLDLALAGGRVGSSASRLDTTLTLRNGADEPIPFSLVQLADLDLAGGPAGDTAARATSEPLIWQVDGPTSFEERVIQRPDVVQVGALPDLLDRIALGGLVDAPGPTAGDVAFALEWQRRLLAPGGSVVFHKTWTLSGAAVAEPGSLGMLGLAVAAGLAARRPARGAG